MGLLLLLGGAMVSLKGSGVLGHITSSAAGCWKGLVGGSGLGGSLSSAGIGGEDLDGWRDDSFRLRGLLAEDMD